MPCRWKKEVVRAPLFCVLFVLFLFSCGEDLVYYDNQPIAYKVVETVNIKKIADDSLVDILFVIDNSASMNDEQKILSINTNSFIQQFSKRFDVNWKIGIISTDDKDSPYLGFAQPFNSNTPNIVTSFQDAVGKLGVKGNIREKTFDTTVRALINYPYFIRSTAFFAVIAITDAEDQSNQFSADDFVQKIYDLLGHRRFKYYGVLGPGSFGCSHDVFLEYIGGRHEKAISLTGGEVYTLCSQDFGQLLATIADNIVQEAILQPRIILKNRPNTSTIIVNHRGNILKPGPLSEGGLWYYDYDMNAIVFHHLDFATEIKEDVFIAYTEKLRYEERL